MVRLFLIIISLSPFFGSFGSEQKADSLRTVADTINTDSGRANALDYLVWSYMSIDTDEAIKVANEQIIAAKKSKMPVKISKAYFNLATAHAVDGLLEESIPIFYKGLEEAEKANSPKRKSEILNNLGLVYKLIANSDSAISCYKLSVQEFKKLPELNKGLADAYNNI